jgi:hypothetical protein
LPIDLENTLVKIIQRELGKVLQYGRLELSQVEIEAYKNDPVFSLFLLDSKDIVLARDRGAFVMSITRKLGDLYQNCVNEILKYSLGLSSEQIKYSAHIAGEERSLDCRVSLKDLGSEHQQRIRKIIKDITSAHRDKYHGKVDFDGLGFEIRYCYQIGDSKRIQADLHMANNLFENNILPVMLIFCSTSLPGPVRRFRNRSYWTVKEGLESYNFVYDLTGFNFLSFLKEDPKARSVIESIMKKIYAKFEAGQGVQKMLMFRQR